MKRHKRVTAPAMVMHFARNVAFNFLCVFSITAKTTNSLNTNSHGWYIYGVLCSMFWHLTLKLSLLDWFLQKTKAASSLQQRRATNRGHFSFQLSVIEMMVLATQRKQNRALLRESFIVCITRLPITGHATISNLTMKPGTASVICLHSSYQSSKTKFNIKYFSIFLPPATKLGQGNVFTGVYDSVNGGGVCLSACWDTTTPPEANTPGSRHRPGTDTPQKQTPHGSRHPWEQTPPWSRHPLEQTPPPCRACWEIRSTRGQYASYWNAILLK